MILSSKERNTVIQKNNKFLDFNVKTSTSNERFSKFLRIESKEHSLGFSKVKHEKIHFKSLALISNEAYAT